jgi:hypothetical protein
MKNYAIIENNTITNVIAADVDMTPEASWTDLSSLPAGAWIGWTTDGSTWTAPGGSDE